jgi:hypothetical protein
MIDKETNDFLDLDNVEIEYNEDIDTTKTKSLTKFPNKIVEFNLDNASQNFSKSLNFNSHKCYAPKIKHKQYLKKPSPIFFKKINYNNNLKIPNEPVIEEILSEKEPSLMDEDSSSDFIIDDFDENNNNNNGNKNENEPRENQNKKPIDDLINIYKEDKKPKEEKNNDFKLYEHKTIGTFAFHNNVEIQDKNQIKLYRNNLCRIKMKYAKIINREQEFSLNDELKNKYGLNLIFNNKKTNVDNEYKIIPINNDENSDSEEENDISTNLRETISYNQSKLKKKKNNEKKNEKDKPKIVNILEVLRKSVK